MAQYGPSGLAGLQRCLREGMEAKCRDEVVVSRTDLELLLRVLIGAKDARDVPSEHAAFDRLRAVLDEGSQT